MFKKIAGEIETTFLANKYATFLLLLASFFVMLSAKVMPIIYAPLQDGLFNPLYDFYEIFPLSFFDCFLWILIFISLKSITGVLSKYIYTKEFSSRKINSKTLIWVALFFVLSWLPYFLTFYPGTAMHDEIFAMRDPFGCSNQPLFYNYFLAFLWDFGKFFGDETLGFGIFYILKMFVMAFTLSYLLMFLYKRGISKYFLVLCALIFAFFPIFPNYAICIFKDTPFAICILLLTLFLHEHKDNYEKIVAKKYPFFIFLLLSLMLIWLRSNGLYIILFTIFPLMYLSKKVRIRFFALAIIFVLAGILPNQGRNVPFRETIGVPIQQVARTLIVNGEISEENKKIFSNTLELSLFKNNYIAFGVDPVKGNEALNNSYLDTHKGEFLKAWIETFPKNISTYLTAQFFETYEFWATSPWEIYTIDGYLISQTIFAHAITQKSLANTDIPSENWNDKLVTSEKNFLPKNFEQYIGAFMKNNVFYLNGGVCGLILLIFMAITFQLDRGRRIISILPVFWAWVTILFAAPIAFAFRYVFYFALVMPFILSLPFMIDEKNNNEKTPFNCNTEKDII